MGVDSTAAPAGRKDCTTSQAVIVPAVLMAVMLLVGAWTAQLAHLTIGSLVFPYFSSAGACTLLALLVVLFVEALRLASSNTADPLVKLRARFLPRLPLLILPVAIFPLFMIGFTATKSAIPFLVGYSWDRYWAGVDLLIFRTDPWRITHQLFGTKSLWFWQWFYAVAWGAAFFFSAALVPLYASRRFVRLFFAAMFSTWLLGGFVLAYSFSAAGPVFAHMVDPSLAMRFAPLRTALADTLDNGPIALTQHYLESAVQSHATVMGGGISAMPSMHIATATIYLLASRGTRWLYPALAFLLIIFIASAYFGYHYWIDGIAGAAVAFICWRMSAWLLSDRRNTKELLRPWRNDNSRRPFTISQLGEG